MASEKPYLIEMICSLVDYDVDFVICGGMAAVYHGVERMTMDLDLSLNMEKENLLKFLEAMKALRLTPRAPVPAEAILDPEQIKSFVRDKHAMVFTFWDKDCPYRQIDIFLAADDAYDHMVQHTIDAHVDDKKVKILSVDKLLEMKLKMESPRDKDILDIEALKRITKGVTHE